MGRNEDILQAIIDGTGSQDLPKPKSRNEALLMKLLEMLENSPAVVDVITDAEIDALFA